MILKVLINGKLNNVFLNEGLNNKIVEINKNKNPRDFSITHQ